MHSTLRPPLTRPIVPLGTSAPLLHAETARAPSCMSLLLLHTSYSQYSHLRTLPPQPTTTYALNNSHNNIQHPRRSSIAGCFQGAWLIDCLGNNLHHCIFNFNTVPVMAAILATKVALKAISLGAEHIPDKVFEAIPGGFYKKKDIKREVREYKERHSDRRPRRSRRDSFDSEDDYQSDYHTSGAESYRSRSRRRSRDRRHRRRTQSMGSNPRSTRDYRDYRNHSSHRDQREREHRDYRKSQHDDSQPRSQQFQQDGWDPVRDFGRQPAYTQHQTQYDPYAPKPYNPADYVNGAQSGVGQNGYAPQQVCYPGTASLAGG